MKSIGQQQFSWWLWLLILTSVANAQTYSLLYSFSGGADGGGPSSQLIRDSSGNSFGVANWGGNLNCPFPIGCGVVFELSATGAFTVLHTFTGKDGIGPFGSVVADDANNLYGTTAAGGKLALNCSGGKPFGCGVVYRLNTVTGKMTVIHRFAAGSDGGSPNGVIGDAAGNLFGATALGGLAGCGNNGSCGTVYKIDSTGKHTVLYRFTGGADGGLPIGVVRDRQGNLYGTTRVGGDLDCNQNSGWGAGCGTVFELSTAGKFAVLHVFTGGDDGENIESYATLLRDSQGNLYSETPYGGLQDCSGDPGCGVVYKLSAEGKETPLYSFTGGKDGADPSYGLTYDKAGNIYGTTTLGGYFFGECLDGGCGTVFELDRNDKLTTLYSFTNGADGYYPSFLAADAVGNLYGETTGGGGAFGTAGTIFKITP